MKLKNKKTGEIRDGVDVIIENLRKNGTTLEAICLDEIKEEWEDYKEPKKYWRITDLGELKSVRLDQHHQNIEKCKEIGNYFETKEEAEKAVEKLKAFKRLKDKGFKFEDLDVRLTEYPWNTCELCIDAIMPADAYTDDEVNRDLDICFGGKK